MDSVILPAVGTQVRRKADGVLGEVYAIDPPHDLLSVRWPTVPGSYGRQDCTPEQFARSWDLTGIQLAPPHETKVALGLIAFIVLFVFTFIMVRDSRSTYLGYDRYWPLVTMSPETMNNAHALYEKFGMTAASACASGADDYIRSITGHRFHWNDGVAIEPRFNHYNPAVAAPGVLTLISGKASVSNGFGTFNPVIIYCDYDTQSNEVLFYASNYSND